jgi:SAM-dependent methyltransferase
MRKKPYVTLVSHYESCLDRHGDSHKGVDWPNAGDTLTRYETMLGVIPAHETNVSLLDFGCGASGLYQYLLDNRLDHIQYSGIDLSRRFVDLSRKKFPSVRYRQPQIWPK